MHLRRFVKEPRQISHHLKETNDAASRAKNAANKASDVCGKGYAHKAVQMRPEAMSVDQWVMAHEVQ